MTLAIWEHLNPLDVEGLTRRYRASEPTHHFVVDDFLRPEFLRELVAAYPSYQEALEKGHQFRAVNENLKIQITEPAKFPAPVRTLHEILASRELVQAMARITGIEELLADQELSGGGMHVMGSGGRLDVHVDFNIIRDRALYRRLNILVFLNEEWHDNWGGEFELWDPAVEHRFFSAAPLGNRCVVFNTTETSYHGVTPIKSPRGVTRNSFAAYYYTKEAPAETDGTFHSTVFKPRPSERWRQRLLVPAESSAKALRKALGGVKRTLLRRPKEDEEGSANP